MESRKEFVDLYIPDTWKGKGLEEAREYVNKNKENGSLCPCCAQLCRVYYRKFNRNMAKFLISLAKKSTETKKWVHYKECDFFSRDYAAITYWGLAVVRKSDGETKKSSGYWLPTRKGVDFIEDKIKIPSHAIIFNGKVDWSRGGFSNRELTIKEALGEWYSHEELMGARKVVQGWNVLSEEPRTVEVLKKSREVKARI